MSTLFLIPSYLGESDYDAVFPEENRRVITSLKYFIVEDVRSARRFLKQVEKSINIDELTFFTLGKHTDQTEVPSFLAPLKQGQDVGVISEAGCPGIADPGADVVRLAHEKGFAVCPLIGPSSILLAMMASGMNGQNFAFNGYLPKDKADLNKEIKRLETLATHHNQSQIFIETPFRNNNLLSELITVLNPNTRLCVATDLATKNQKIISQSVQKWRGTKNVDLDKKPSIFIIGRG